MSLRIKKHLPDPRHQFNELIVSQSLHSDTRITRGVATLFAASQPKDIIFSEHNNCDMFRMTLQGRILWLTFWENCVLLAAADIKIESHVRLAAGSHGAKYPNTALTLTPWSEVTGRCKTLITVEDNK